MIDDPCWKDTLDKFIPVCGDWAGCEQRGAHLHVEAAGPNVRITPTILSQDGFHSSCDSVLIRPPSSLAAMVGSTFQGRVDLAIRKAQEGLYNGLGLGDSSAEEVVAKTLSGRYRPPDPIPPPQPRPPLAHY